MRYYIIALFINLLILSIPVNANYKEKQNNKIQISIYENKNKEEMKEENNEEVKEESKEEIKEESKEEIEKESEVESKEEIIKKKIEKKIEKKIKNNNKVINKNSQNKNSKKTTNAKQENNTKNNINNENNTQSINENICASAIKFYNIKNNYPKKAIKLSLYGRYAVKIIFSIDKNKNIRIIKATGKEPFLSEAKKAILKIDYEIYNFNFTLCEYEKTIIYELK